MSLLKHHDINDYQHNNHLPTIDRVEEDIGGMLEAD